ncbi:P-loop NTPase fold protein [Streptomyces virginiae]|uniref:P-loop NTPase fold protein n=1 Tax=Streptomyces virginiae TaxID=1961 RepID=UPI00345DF013
MAQASRSWILEDSAIDSHDQDRFDHLSVARELSTILRGSQRSLAIGLLGPFGSGKSSVVRLLNAELKGNKAWAVVHLSAERHTGSARARGLLYGLLDDLKSQRLISQSTWHSERACLESGRQRVDTRPSATSDRPGLSRHRYVVAAAESLGWMAATLAAIWLLGVLLVLVGQRFDLGAGVSAWAWFAAPGAGPMTAIALSAAVTANVLGTVKDGAVAALKRYDITLTTPRPESTDDLEQVFARVIGGINRRLVIAIDDIDRLAATEVLEALTTIRSLLLTGTHLPHPPVFLLSCDEDIVREAIVGVRPGLAHRPVDAATNSGPSPVAQPERKATEEAAQEYLNKLFTVRLVLPEHHGGDLRDYAERLLTYPSEHGAVAALGGMRQIHDVLDLIVHPDVTNPRHVIRLLNGFLTDFALAVRREQSDLTGTPRIAPGEVTGHPLTLARLTVLRHDFPRLYDAVRAEHDLLALLDDALLGSTTGLDDPLLKHFTEPCTEEISSPRRLNMTALPGLHYLLATASRSRPNRPAHLTPLLTLGSTPASRTLGSDQAALIHRELVQRDTESFAARLADQEGRRRVLEAASHTLGNVRRGLDLDNSLTAAVQALGRTPDLVDHAAQNTEARRALQSFTEVVARRRTDAITAVPAHDLIAALDAFPEAHLPSLYTSLSVPPAAEPGVASGNEQPPFKWAQAIIALPAGRHTHRLHAALARYLTDLSASGSADDLTTWITAFNATSPERQEAWPPQAYQALLSMVVRADDDDLARDVYAIVQAAENHHKWQRPVMEGLLAWLNTDDNARRGKAIELLQQVTVPNDGWGPPGPLTPSAPTDSTLAAQLGVAAARFLEDAEDASTSQVTANLLHAWLPTVGHHTTAPDLLLSTVVARAVGITSHSCIELANTTAPLMADLPQRDAGVFAKYIAQSLRRPEVTDQALRNSLAEALMAFLRRAQDSTDPNINQASAACLAALTESLDQPDDRGAYSRRYLPAVMTTRQGREAGPALADQLLTVIGNYNQTHADEALEGLCVLFHVPEIRDEKLPPVLQPLQNWMSAKPLPAVSFAARHAEHLAVTTTWLSWIAQHWEQLSKLARTGAVAAAGRSDLGQTPLPNLLARQICDSTDATTWSHTDALWNLIGTDQRAALFAAADGRCPALAERAKVAEHTVLDVALNLATIEQLPALLALLADSPQLAEATCTQVERHIGDRDWDEARMASLAVACPDTERLWVILFKEAGNDQTTFHRVIGLVEALITTRPDSVPRTFTEHLGPVLETASPENAAALGKAVKPLPALARRLARELTGQGRTQEGKQRMRAFKTAAGIS